VPTRDLHAKPFDQGTKTKLAIYRSYVRAWLQVFLHAELFRGKALQFFDFFCGPGQDSINEPGSPLILINELLAQREKIEQHGHEIRILFNDEDQEKIRDLKQVCSEKALSWKPQFESMDFADAFKKVRTAIGQQPSLIFIDQNGLKHVTPQVFSALTEASTTDFIFFTASSFKHRFRELLAPEIIIADNVSYLEIHRALADAYRRLAPQGMFIGHFSIKKETNIYGLVFGSHHWRGMQKFLEIAWKLDASCGESNYEMDANAAQGEMFFEQGRTGFKKRKTEIFQEKISEFIEFRESTTDQDVFLYCLTNGFLPRLAKDVYERMRREQFLKNDRRNFPRYSDVVMKEPRQLII
jgi:three-Cys-motif partner protein